MKKTLTVMIACVLLWTVAVEASTAPHAKKNAETFFQISAASMGVFIGIELGQKVEDWFFDGKRPLNSFSLFFNGYSIGAVVGGTAAIGLVGTHQQKQGNLALAGLGAYLAIVPSGVFSLTWTEYLNYSGIDYTLGLQIAKGISVLGIGIGTVMGYHGGRIK